MWEELLKDVEIIKWAVICMAVSLWGLTAYFFLKAVPEWWHGSNKKKREKTIHVGADEKRFRRIN